MSGWNDELHAWAVTQHEHEQFLNT